MVTVDVRPAASAPRTRSDTYPALPGLATTAAHRDRLWVTRSAVHVLPPLTDAHAVTPCAAIGLPPGPANQIGTVVFVPRAAAFRLDRPRGTIRGHIAPG